MTAAWRWAVARAEAISYTTAFAPDLAVDDLTALAGWTPALTAAQASRLTEAAAGGASREQFVALLHGETGLGNTWTEGFLTAQPSLETRPDNENGSP